MTDLNDKIEYLRRRLRARVEDSAKTRQEIAAKFLKSDREAAHAIKWMQGVARGLLVAQFAQDVLDLMGNEGETPESWARRYLARMEEEIRRWAPEYSTSQFSNVVNNDRLEAMREVAEILEGALR